MPAGDAAKGFFAFDQFDKELRSALTRKDATAMALLVRFPLRVNDAGGAISIDDATALQSHFNEVFTPAVRKEILNSPTDGGCNVEGIGYGRGGSGSTLQHRDMRSGQSTVTLCHPSHRAKICPSWNMYAGPRATAL
jgi:hypothetical protein